MKVPEYERNAFINCPFDRPYKRIFDAIVFAVFDCGFVARSAQEITNTAEIRVEKIARIIDECRFGLHDLSRTSLDRTSRLPRFNDPLSGATLELGDLANLGEFIFEDYVRNRRKRMR